MKQSPGKNNAIPKIWSWLIDRCIVESDIDHLKGDYEEIYCQMRRSEGQRAHVWICRQIVISAMSNFFDSTYWGIHMLTSYMKQTLRNLLKHRIFSIINILGLAMGLACTIMILYWIQDELSTDQFHEHRKNLYVATFSNGSITTPTALSPFLKNEYPEIIETSRFQFSGTILLKTEKTEANQEGCIFVDPSFLDMFTFSFIKGDPATALLDPYSILISKRVAKKYFGADDPIGKTIIFNAQTDLNVTGVFENYPHNSHFECEYILPLSLTAAGGRDLNTWDRNNIRTYVMVQPGTHIQSINKKIENIVEKHRPQDQRTLCLQPMTRIYLNPMQHNNNPITTVYLFSALAFFILLIACINFMNLSTAKSTIRAREVGIRKTVGAQRSNLIRQFFSESLMMSFLSLLLAFLLVYLVLPHFATLTRKPFVFADFLRQSTVLGILGIGILTGIIAGSYPALFLSQFQPVRVLKGERDSSKHGTRFRKVLVVIQFTLSILLILSTLMIHRQLTYLRDFPLGYNKENIVFFGIGGRFRRNIDTIKTDWMANPDILNVSLMSISPYRWNTNAGYGDVQWDGKTNQKVKMVLLSVDPDYLDTFGMEMSEGRFFSNKITTDGRETFIINEAAVRAMEMDSPVGKSLRIWDYNGRIIGVVRDYHFESLRNDIIPMAMFYNRNGMYQACVRIAPGRIRGALNFIEEKWKVLYPEYPFEYQFLDDRLDSLYQREERTVSIVSTFTLLAILISCLGLFGLVSFATEQRTKEVGIRKSCGATVPSLLILLSKDFLKLVLLSFMISIPLAYWLTAQMLKEFAYRTTMNPWLVLGAGGVSVVIALFTVSFHTYKAAKANPVDSLRYE